MSYTPEFRQFVVKKIHNGMPRSEAIIFFEISRDSLYRWLKKYSETGEVLDAPRKEYATRKIYSQTLIDIRSLWQNTIESVGCRLLYQPPYSPDLNPIEQQWAILKRKFRKHKHKFKTFNEAVDYAFAV